MKPKRFAGLIFLIIFLSFPSYGEMLNSAFQPVPPSYLKKPSYAGPTSFFTFGTINLGLFSPFDSDFREIYGGTLFEGSLIFGIKPSNVPIMILITPIDFIGETGEPEEDYYCPYNYCDFDIRFELHRWRFTVDIAYLLYDAKKTLIGIGAGFGYTSAEEELEYDIEYCDNWGCFSDHGHVEAKEDILVVDFILFSHYSFSNRFGVFSRIKFSYEPIDSEGEAEDLGGTSLSVGLTIHN